MSQSPIQRFINELRRRHVPQTAAIYLVAAWAAIEFADVVVPNLDGPQWVVTTVIVAALVGFPVVLVLAWIFDWGAEGIHRTDPGGPESAGRDRGAPETDPALIPGVSGRPQPWLPVLAVLLVGIGSALAAAYVIQGETSGEAAAPAVDTASTSERTARDEGRRPPVPQPPELRMFSGLADSIGEQLRRSLGEIEALDSMDLSGLAALGRAAAARAGVGIFMREPAEWRIGSDAAPPGLPEGDTLRVVGVAMDTAGVVSVTVDGRLAIQVGEPEETLAFEASLVGLAGAGTRTVPIVATTADGRELRREFEVIQLPSGTP